MDASTMSASFTTTQVQPPDILSRGKSNDQYQALLHDPQVKHFYPSFRANMRGWKFEVEYRGRSNLVRVNTEAFLQAGRIKHIKDTFLCSTTDAYEWCLAFGIPSTDREYVLFLLHWELPMEQWLRSLDLHKHYGKFMPLDTTLPDTTEPYGDDYAVVRTEEEQLAIEEYFYELNHQVEVTNAAGDIIRAIEGSVTNYNLQGN